MTQPTLLERVIRRLSLAAPNVRPLNVALLGALFILKNNRLPTAEMSDDAEVNDFNFWRSVGSWSQFERECVDKETAKLAARRLCPEIGAAETIEVIRADLLGFDEFLARVSRYFGENMVIKPTQGSGNVLFLRDRPSTEDLRQLHRAARRSYFAEFREAQYYGLKKKIMIERMIAEPATLSDYKFFCSRGVVLVCQVDSDRVHDHRLTHYSVPDFVEYRGVANEFPEATQPLPKPEHWQALIDYAARLSAPFDFVRVDLYDLPTGVMFGEFTFTPGAAVNRYSDPEFSRWLVRQVRKISGSGGRDRPEPFQQYLNAFRT